MIEGGSSKKFDEIRRLAIKDRDFFQKLIDILVNSISTYLIEQIKSGFDVVKIFDSWAGILPESEFRKWVIEPNQKIVQNIKRYILMCLLYYLLKVLEPCMKRLLLMLSVML